MIKPFPKPSIPRHKRARLPKRETVTIAAAMRCRGGIVLCSDSLISGGDVNDAQRKIIPFNVPALHANVVVAFAGTVAYCLSAIKRFASALNSIPESRGPLTKDLFESTLTDVLLRFYKKQIFPRPDYGYTTAPSVHLIAVLQDHENKQTSIFASSETVVNECGESAFFGAGQSIAWYIVEPLICVSLASMDDSNVLILADHMLHQVQTFVPGCGGVSQFFYVSNGRGFCEPYHQPLLPVERSNTFRRIVAELFYASADFNLDDDLVNIGLHLTDSRIKQIRDEQRSERERRNQLGPKLFDKPLIGLGPTVDKYFPKP